MCLRTQFHLFELAPSTPYMYLLVVVLAFLVEATRRRWTTTFAARRLLSTIPPNKLLNVACIYTKDGTPDRATTARVQQCAGLAQQTNKEAGCCFQFTSFAFHPLLNSFRLFVSVVSTRVLLNRTGRVGNRIQT